MGGNTFFKYLNLYWQFFKQRLKVMMEYRTDFFIGVTSIIFVQGTSVLFITTIFNHIHKLHGWTFYEILYIYGISLCGRAVEQIFFDNIWTIGFRYIRTGHLDRLLIRPINPLFHIIADCVQKDGLGSLITGVMVLYISIKNQSMDWGIIQTILLILMILSSALIFMGINLFFATFSFWMVDSLPVMTSVFSLNEFARYPITIYNKGLQFILTWIIPYGFTAFYPANLFIDGGFRMIAIWTPCVALITCTIAYLFWLKGLKSFVSTGN
ncbi:ABC transporter permease [Bacillus paramycoides]|uniref:ABC transporter permease n=1 Tax=Bacillus paramycoides TaxID=2026194 RepID=UPI002E240C03|nr:ABC-2 family transporter protein [Bacillus paramycoides]